MPARRKRKVTDTPPAKQGRKKKTALQLAREKARKEHEAVVAKRVRELGGKVRIKGRRQSAASSARSVEDEDDEDMEEEGEVQAVAYSVEETSTGRAGGRMTTTGTRKAARMRATFSNGVASLQSAESAEESYDNAGSRRNGSGGGVRQRRSRIMNTSRPALGDIDDADERPQRVVSSRRTVTRTVRRSSGDGERVVTTTRTETSSSGADENDDDSSSSSSVGFFGFLFFVIYIALSVVAYAALFAGLTMCLATFSPESYSTAALSYDAAVRLVFADDAATQLLQAVDIIYAAGIVGGLTGLLLGMRNVKFMASAYD